MTYPIKIFWGDLSECVTRGFNFDLYLHCIFAYYPIKKKLANLDGNCISSLTDNGCLSSLYISDDSCFDIITLHSILDKRCFTHGMKSQT